MKLANVQFSHGTLNPIHLLDASLVYLSRDTNVELYNDVRRILNTYDDLSYNAEIYDVVYDVFNYLESLADDGYYFGCTEGDGSDFGWWKIEGED